MTSLLFLILAIVAWVYFVAIVGDLFHADRWVEVSAILLGSVLIGMFW